MSEDLFDDLFSEGGLTALEIFRDQLVKSRGLIENQTEPPFDVILGLLNRVIRTMKAVHT